MAAALTEAEAGARSGGEFVGCALRRDVFYANLTYSDSAEGNASRRGAISGKFWMVI